MSPQTRPWLHSAPVDLVVGAGLWSLPLLALVGAASAVNEPSVTLLFYVGALFCNQPHYMATVWRGYRNQADRQRFRSVTVYATLGIAALLVAVLWSPRWLPVFFALYLTWSPFHYTAQNYGIAFILLGRAGLQPSAGERRALKVGFTLSYLAWALALHSGPQTPTLFKLSLDPDWTRPVQFVLWTVGAVLVGVCLVQWALRSRAGQRGAVVFVAVLCATQGLWLVLAGLLEALSDDGVSPFLISGGALAFLHCAQYLWVIEYAERRAPRSARYRPVIFFVVLVLGGIALFLLGPWVLHATISYDILTAVLAFQAAINIHHFVIDGAIWKLRGTAVGRTMQGEPSADAKSTAGTKRFVGVLAIVVSTALVTVWGLDLVRTLGSLQGASPAWHDAAMSLTPHHTPFVIEKTAMLVSAERNDEAEVVLREAIAAGNRTHGVHRALARLLDVMGRPEEALKAYESSALVLHADAASLLHQASLYQGLGRTDDAYAAVQAALRADRFSPNGYYALAALERVRGNAAAADAAEAEGQARDTSRADPDANHQEGPP